MKWLFDDSINVQDDRHVIFEFKYAQNESDLDALAKEALKQIKEKGYAKSWEEAGNTVIRIGVAFYKKKCKVLFGE